MNLSARGVGRAPLLLVLCGPSHAGKTTFANRLCMSGRRFTVISPDNIRQRLRLRFGDPEHESRVWNTYESMKCKALSKGRNVILDACHISKRARWHGLQGPNSGYRKICVVFDLPLRTVRERCIKEKRVSLQEVERMWRAFQKSKPTVKELKAEGFDEVYFITEGPAYAG
jgi:predicted kinase